MTEPNPFFRITEAIHDAIEKDKAESLLVIDEFRQEVLKLMLEVTPASWTKGFEIPFTSEVVNDNNNEPCDVVSSELFDAGFDLAHMVGAKFVIRPILDRIFSMNIITTDSRGKISQG